MGTVGDGAEASDRTHITESKQLWVPQNDLREPEMKLEAKPSSLQHWLQLTYELELHNYNAKKTIAEQQLQAAEEGVWHSFIFYVYMCCDFLLIYFVKLV